jgi:hypothetical protein
MACGSVSPDVPTCRCFPRLKLTRRNVTLENTFRKSGLYIFNVFMLTCLHIAPPALKSVLLTGVRLIPSAIKRGSHRANLCLGKSDDSEPRLSVA